MDFTFCHSHLQDQDCSIPLLFAFITSVTLCGQRHPFTSLLCTWDIMYKSTNHCRNRLLFHCRFLSAVAACCAGLLCTGAAGWACPVQVAGQDGDPVSVSRGLTWPLEADRQGCTAVGLKPLSTFICRGELNTFPSEVVRTNTIWAIMTWRKSGLPKNGDSCVLNRTFQSPIVKSSCKEQNVFPNLTVEN